ncbi:MAG TPA: 30S ribosomal protein S13 [Candidatus Paceibacterota bacterium]|nr:30S ribosomal protein S13 [Candidatus Paceibacterota bacterium]
MLRISGVNLPEGKRIEAALPYLYGIGLSLSRKILKELKMDPNVRVKDIPEAEVNKLRDYIEKNYKIEGDLKRENKDNIKRLIDIGAYRGSRHIRHLPTRGQRTKTNCRTVRGNTRKTVTSGKHKVELK